MGRSAVNRYANGNQRRKDRAWLKSLGLPCAICGRDIDYDLPPGSPLSFEVDEILPVSCGGSLSRDNLQPVHRCCNEAKGNKVGFTLEAPRAKCDPPENIPHGLIGGAADW